MMKRAIDTNEGAKFKRAAASPHVVSYRLDKVMLHSENLQTKIDYLWKTAGADKIFRTQNDFVIWLNSSNPGLGGVAPIHYIQSDIQKISDLLGRILYGVLA